MTIHRTGSATWSGGLKDGRGTISTESGAMSNHPYGFAMRFEGVKGTNPEELIGAAHAGCFSMALSAMLTEAGFPPERLDTTARVALDKQEDGFAITSSHLTLKAKIPGLDEARFMELANRAKNFCPVSKVLKAELRLDATLLP